MSIKKLFFPFIVMAGILSSCTGTAQKTTLSVDEFEKAIAASNIQILDVRTMGEYQGGFINNALQANWNDQNEFQQRVKALDKKKPVYAYCLSGKRSAAAVEWLNQNGFTAYNMVGGINAWRNAGKKLEQSVQAEQITLQQYMAEVSSDKTVLVDFSAVWCPPCKVMAPVMDSLVATNGTQFKFLKIDGGQQTAIGKELKVEGFPTFIIYKDGKEVWRKEGIVDKKEILEKL